MGCKVVRLCSPYCVTAPDPSCTYTFKVEHTCDGAGSAATWHVALLVSSESYGSMVPVM